MFLTPTVLQKLFNKAQRSIGNIKLEVGEKKKKENSREINWRQEVA